MNHSNIKEEFKSFLLVDKKYSKNTIDSYMNDYDKFTSFFQNKSITNITTSELENYLSHLKKEQLSSTSISHNISDIDMGVQEITSSVDITAKSANDLAVSTDSIAESMKDLNDSSQKNVSHSSQLNEQISKYIF